MGVGVGVAVGVAAGLGLGEGLSPGEGERAAAGETAVVAAGAGAGEGELPGVAAGEPACGLAPLVGTGPESESQPVVRPSAPRRARQVRSQTGDSRVETVAEVTAQRDTNRRKSAKGGDHLLKDGGYCTPARPNGLLLGAARLCYHPGHPGDAGPPGSPARVWPGGPVERARPRTVQASLTGSVARPRTFKEYTPVTRWFRLLASLCLLLQLLGTSALAQPEDEPPFLSHRIRATPAPAEPYAPGSVLVKLVDDDAALLDDVAARGFLGLQEVREVADAAGVRRLAVAPGQEEAAAEALRADPRVAWAEPDYTLAYQLTPNDRYYAKWQWYMRQIGAEGAWDLTTGAADVIVAIVDSGVDPDHPEFKSRLVPGYNFVGDNADTRDTVGHGTAIAGLVGAQGNNSAGVAGLAWRTRLMPLRVGDEEGAKSSDAARAVRWAVDNGARVINLSLGTSRRSRVLEEAVDYAYKKGALIVAAAGNEYESGNPVEYPAAFANAIAVGAVRYDGARASYSNTGAHVKLVAPGGDAKGKKDNDPNNWIFSTFYDVDTHESTYAGGVGTSLSAPIVAGAAALVWSVNPSLTNAEVEQILLSTTDKLGNPNDPRNDEFGFGRVNVGRAVRAALPRTVQFGVDAPAPGATISGLLKVSGWATDFANQAGSGIESVQIYLGAPPPAGTLLGQAQLGVARGDVVASTNHPAALNSGFELTVDTTRLADGDHTLYIVVQPVQGPPVVTTLTVTVANRRPGLPPAVGPAAPTGPAAPSAPAAPVVPETARLSLDSVPAGSEVSGAVLVQGWAVDPGATGGTGIAAVQVYLDAPMGEGAALGPVQYGLPRPDVAAALGNPAFAASGWQFTWDTRALAPGGHRLYVYALRPNGEVAGTLTVPVVVGG